VQNGDTIASQIVQVDSIKYLMFDVLPDNGVITLIRSRTTGLKSDNMLTFPSSFELQQNYPNPFNPSTVISYQLPVSSFVTLKVYDVVGREAKTLVSSRENAGTYAVRFEGSSLASGIYFYRLRADNFAAVRKLVLLK
jgi:hypothetical protein